MGEIGKEGGIYCMIVGKPILEIYLVASFAIKSVGLACVSKLIIFVIIVKMIWLGYRWRREKGGIVTGTFPIVCDP